MANVKSRRKDVSMKDVARLAGVSVASVSGVLAENLDISVADGTRARILEAARKVNYVYPKRRTRPGTTPFPILVLARYGLDNPVAREIFEGIEQGLHASQGRMLFSVLDHAHPYQVLQRFPDMHDIRGAIFLSRISDVVSETLALKGIPYILIGSSIKSRDVDMAYTDPIDYADHAADYLVSLGHRRICSFFSTPHYAYDIVSERFRQRVTQLTGSAPTSIFYGENESPFTAFDRVLSQSPSPTAVFGQMCDVHAGLLSGAMSIPDDLSVLTVDSPGSIVEKPLTFVGSDNVELGREGANMLMQRIKKPSRPVRHTLFPAEIHDKGSCARRSSFVVQEPRLRKC